MAKLFLLISLIAALALLACAVSAGPVSKYDNRGRYNPAYNDPYYNSRYYKNRDFYNNRRYYDNFFKKYNPEVPAAQARIVEQTAESPQDGVYSYSYETENGIHGEEHGTAVKLGRGTEQKEVVAGSFSFITPDGLRVGVKYTADENGFHPVITYDGVNAEHFAKQQQPADVAITKIH